MAQQQQQQNESDPVRVAGDPTKISAFDIIERNIIRDVESSRKTEFQSLESASNQNTFGGLVGRIGLETFDKYRNTAARVASYVNQAYQAAIDHHNYLTRREELDAPELTFTARDIASVADKASVFDSKIPIEVVGLLTRSLMITDAGGTQEGAGFRVQALGVIERNVTTSVEKTRRTTFQTLATGNQQNTFGGLAGRIGLETVARYRLSDARIKSYINQAYQAAMDHYNFVARRESYHKTQLTFIPLVADSSAFDVLIPAEVVRLIVLSYIQNDSADRPMAGPSASGAMAMSRNE
jgi:hypothetical protein